ncbi:Nramp family divalent metal transporter [Pseudomaricurvus alkylphenolicus]|jgi:Mn2+/Fe2+ NRAMP family transporter|uniref:Nramp family divalent metal transporter n=1 Tax=Pseudomaricurvus alkylphenolicus TaxID=1306991 RepID=UPI0014230287|nr:Nramp family divalent metal transporter [Pseudomaricurvus alkylphenolicus]NIB42225.1 Nramp family divalent metal transporter [Pseudomaricurvus alkylphenolicus]
MKSDQPLQSVATEHLPWWRQLSVLGPGLLFAATSVGTSHLVQSTRAGALYGLALMAIIVVANILKYPAFRFASDYFPATGTTLLEAYRRQGRWVLCVYFLITLTTLLFAVSVLALMSAGLIKVVFVLSIPAHWLALGLIGVTAALLVVGHYQTLERVTKALVLLMMVCTLVATVTVIPEISWEEGMQLLPTDLDIVGLLFIAALIGWMPVPLDASVWQSLWAKAKAESSEKAPTLAQSRFDFNLGFFGTLVLAICFLLLGAGLMHGKGIELQTGSAAFSAQLISLYQGVFGSSTGPVIGLAALAIIYSSLLALMDAFPRTLSSLHRRWLDIPEAQDDHKLTETDPFYLGVLVLMAVGAALTYRYFLTSLTGLIDLAATVAFITAPLIAYLNHKAITAENVPVASRPGEKFRLFSKVSIAMMAGFAVGYLYLRFWLS